MAGGVLVPIGVGVSVPIVVGEWVDVVVGESVPIVVPIVGGLQSIRTLNLSAKH